MTICSYTCMYLAIFMHLHGVYCIGTQFAQLGVGGGDVTCEKCE
jgi:hypothetical protein